MMRSSNARLKWFIIVSAACAILLALPARASEDDVLTSWGEATLDKLVPFLPDASALGFTPELPGRSSDFRAWANDTPHMYPALVTHKNWFFPDDKLNRELEEVAKQKTALREQTNAALEEFQRVHGAELEALRKAHNAQMDAASKQAQALFQQGKYEEGKAVMEKVKEFHYEPLETLTNSLNKRDQELADRERDLLSRRRSVSFRIYTNRTPSTTAYAYPAKPIGTLAGRTLFRQVQGSNPWVNLGVYLGPTNFQNSHVKVADRKPQVKCIVVWAWIISRADTLEADEAAAKKVLATVNYNGLSQLVEP